jgi:hypothetical protein
MAHVKNSIRFLVMVTLCSNFAMVFAGDRFDPYSLSSSSASLRSFQLNKIISGIQNLDSAPLFAFLDKSCEKMHHGCALASKIVADNPKEASAVAVTAIVLGLMLYKSEAIKAYFKSKSLEPYKQKIVGLRDSAVATMDNQIAKIPYPVCTLFVGIRGLIAYLFNNIVAMKGEYVVAAAVAPILGYANSFTPFAALGGAKMGSAVAGCFLTRGWLAIDTEKVIRKMKKVEKKVDVVQESINQGQQAATKNHLTVLRDIKFLNGKIDQLSLDIKDEIEASNKTLSDKVGSSAIAAEQSHGVLKKSIEGVNADLVALIDQVRTLPSKDDNQKIVDAAMAEVIKSFENCIANNVKVSDERTEQRLEVIKQQLKDSFKSLNDQQENQAQKIERLANEFAVTIDEREQNIKALTELVDSTKLSNNKLSEKLESLDNNFIKIQEAFKQSDKKYGEILEEKNKDWDRLQEKLNDQIVLFNETNEKILLELKRNIEAVDKRTDILDEKIDIQNKKLLETIQVRTQEQNKNREEDKQVLQESLRQMQTTSNTAMSMLSKMQEDLIKIKEEADKERQAAVLREESLRQELNVLLDGQMRNGEHLDSLNIKFTNTADGVNEKLNDLQKDMKTVVTVASNLSGNNSKILEGGEQNNYLRNDNNSLNATKRKMKFLENTH